MTSESEILECIRDNFRLASERCEQLGRIGMIPGSWREISRAMDRIEGASRQMAHWRGDTRWLPMVNTMRQCKPRARRWYLTCEWRRFTQLAQVFAQGYVLAENLATRPTGKPGTLILPETVH